MQGRAAAAASRFGTVLTTGYHDPILVLCKYAASRSTVAPEPAPQRLRAGPPLAPSLGGLGCTSIGGGVCILSGGRAPGTTLVFTVVTDRGWTRRRGRAGVPDEDSLWLKPLPSGCADVHHIASIFVVVHIVQMHKKSKFRH
jgi:hypothetical protein